MFLPPVAPQHISFLPLRMDGRGLSVAECEDPKTGIKAIKDFLKQNGVSLSNGTTRRTSAQLRSIALGIALGIALTGGASSSSVAADDPSPAAVAAAEAKVELAKVKLQTTQANNATKIELAKLKLEHEQAQVEKAKVKAGEAREVREDAAERRNYQTQQLIEVSGNSRAGESMARIRRRGGDGKNQERSRSALATLKNAQNFRNTDFSARRPRAPASSSSSLQGGRATYQGTIDYRREEEQRQRQGFEYYAQQQRQQRQRQRQQRQQQDDFSDFGRAASQRDQGNVASSSSTLGSSFASREEANDYDSFSGSSRSNQRVFHDLPSPKKRRRRRPALSPVRRSPSPPAAAAAAVAQPPANVVNLADDAISPSSSDVSS